MKFLSFRCEEFFKTPDALSYNLLKDISTVGGDNYIVEVGRIEVLWNANTHIKVYLRVHLFESDAERPEGAAFKAAVEEFLDLHDLTKYRTYEADFLYVKSGMVVASRVDENGRSDGVFS